MLVLIVLMYISPVDTKTLITIDGHRTIASMHYGAGKIDKHNFVVLHDKVMQFEWHVLRDADSVYLTYVSYRETTAKIGRVVSYANEERKKGRTRTPRNHGEGQWGQDRARVGGRPLECPCSGL